VRIESAQVQVMPFTVTSTTRQAFFFYQVPWKMPSSNQEWCIIWYNHYVLMVMMWSNTIKMSFFCFRTCCGFARLSESHRPLSLKMWMPGINLVTSVSEGCHRCNLRSSGVSPPFSDQCRSYCWSHPIYVFHSYIYQIWMIWIMSQVLLVPYCWVHSHPPNDDLQ
jgi:hypothetical protein